MRLSKIIKQPIITEKSVAQQAQHNRYVFKVDLKANKKQIAREVKNMFDVEVEDVRTMVVPGKKRRKRGTNQFTRSSPWKKAVVTIKAGQQIEMFSDLLGGEK